MTEIVPGVHAIDLGTVYAYLYHERDHLTLIDTGYADHAARVLQEIETIGRRPQDLAQIVVTHSHADHRGALAELVDRTGAQVLVHALDAPVVRGEVPQPLPVLSDLEREPFEQIMAGFVEPPPGPVDRELEDGDEIDLDGGAQAVHVPGHTAGSIAVYLPGRRLLFSGDAAVAGPQGRLMVGVFNVDTQQARASFRKLAALDFEVACFGHGKPLDREASLAFRRLAEKLGR